MSRFSVTFKWEINEREEELAISGKAAPCVSAKLTGHPDSYAPAEGGELEDLEITYADTRLKVSDDIAEELLSNDRFAEKVREALAAA